MKRCKDCKFWEGFIDDDEKESLGQCRKHAPKLRALLLSDSIKDNDDDGESIGREGIWPDTTPDDWCGEFESKEYKNEIILFEGIISELIKAMPGFESVEQIDSGRIKIACETQTQKYFRLENRISSNSKMEIVIRESY